MSEVRLEEDGGLEAYGFDRQRLAKRRALIDEGFEPYPYRFADGMEVAAARALMGAPELLIADESTSSLDADRRESFIRLLFDECRGAGTTLIFVSHDASLEPLFDRSIDLAEINRTARVAEAA